MKGIKILLVVIIILLFIPLYWMFVGSFQDTKGAMIMPPRFFPRNPTLFNYNYLLKENAFTWIKNTVIVELSTVVISCLLSITAGYSFSIYKFKGKKFLFSLYLIPLMIPRISLIIPLYIVIKQLGISGQIPAVILPIVFSPMGIYLAKNYFDSIPKSIIESARIDGASELQILFDIVAPISKPILSAVSLFAGIGALQDYIWQSLVLMKTERQTLIVGLIKSAMERGGADMNMNPVGKSFAAGILLFFPLLIIFIISNKYFVESLGGAVKE